MPSDLHSGVSPYLKNTTTGLCHVLMSSTDGEDSPLPNETLSAIFSQLSPDSLARLAQVSVRFQAVAERVLYSSISIRDILSEDSPIPWRTLRCCRSILLRSHLVDSMSVLHIRWQTDPNSPSSRPRLASASAKLAESLHRLTSLVSLDLILGPVNLALSFPDTLHAIERIIYGTHFPYLRYCSLGADWIKGARTYNGVLNTFLVSLPELRHLRLIDHRSPIQIPATALPHLSSFRGSPDTAASLLPGRPVQNLQLIGHDSDINRENLPRFSNTTTPIRFIDLSVMSIRPTLLRNIALYLPTVKMLKIKLALRHTLHYALAGAVSPSIYLSFSSCFSLKAFSGSNRECFPGYHQFSARFMNSHISISPPPLLLESSSPQPRKKKPFA